MPLLHLENIVKAYQDHVAVQGVSFDVPEGCIFGLLGPNGAGKTSLIRIITNITRADSGQVHLLGEPLSSKHVRQIGYMPEERGLYKKMKVGEELLYLARLKGLSKKEAEEKADYWLQRFGIEDWWNKKVDELSKGMQQKVQFISTVMHEPPLLIFDEPFSGLDPVNTNLIRDEIFRLKEKGHSILFSTHRMEQAEQICEALVLINKGQNVLEGDLKTIKQRFKKNLFRIDFDGDLPTALAEKLQIVEQGADWLTVQLESDRNANALLRHFMEADLRIVAFNEILPSLNEIFIQVVNNGGTHE